MAPRLMVHSEQFLVLLLCNHLCDHQLNPATDSMEVEGGSRYQLIPATTGTLLRSASLDIVRSVSEQRLPNCLCSYVDYFVDFGHKIFVPFYPIVDPL